jgi:hypothetical protein
VTVAGFCEFMKIFAINYGDPEVFCIDTRPRGRNLCLGSRYVKETNYVGLILRET